MRCPARPDDQTPHCEPNTVPKGEEHSLSECDSDIDCGDDAMCLHTGWFGNSGACLCHKDECQQDEDCESNQACVCADRRSFRSRSLFCEGITPFFCHSTCVPAGCRNDADCDPGHYCVASLDSCAKRIERYECWKPGTPCCPSPYDDSNGWLRKICRFTFGDWRCEDVPLCD